MIGNAGAAYGMPLPIQGAVPGDQLRWDGKVAGISTRPALGVVAAANIGLAFGPGRPIDRRMMVGIVPLPRDGIGGRVGVRTDTVVAVVATGIGQDINALGVNPARADARGIGGADGKLLIFDPPPFPFLSRKLKDGGDGLAGNPRLPLRQPALLRRDKAPELAPFPEIDGVIPLVAVFAGGPGFRLAKGVGLVKAAVKGLAPVFGQGLQNGGVAVGVGKGLPVGTVPGDGTGLRLGCPPPPTTEIKANKARAPTTFRRDIAMPSRMKLWLVD